MELNFNQVGKAIVHFSKVVDKTTFNIGITANRPEVDISQEGKMRLALKYSNDKELLIIEDTIADDWICIAPITESKGEFNHISLSLDTLNDKLNN